MLNITGAIDAAAPDMAAAGMPTTADPSFLEKGLINPFSGLLSKAVETGLDIWNLREQRKTGLAIGSLYPTGQLPPESVDPSAYNPAGTGIPQISGNMVAMGAAALLGFGLLITVATARRRR